MIPLKLETLLEGRVVEQDRVEYKRGWNPSDTRHLNQATREWRLKMSEVLSEVEIEKMAPIIRHLQEHGSITPKEAMAVTGKSAATARRYLAVLCDKGVLSVKGNTNAISYSLRNVNRL